MSLTAAAVWFGNAALKRIAGSICKGAAVHRANADAPNWSQTGSTVGSCPYTSSTRPGNRLLSTTTSNTYSRNQSAVTVIRPSSCTCLPHEFSARHRVTSPTWPTGARQTTDSTGTGTRRPNTSPRRRGKGREKGRNSWEKSSAFPYPLPSFLLLSQIVRDPNLLGTRLDFFPGVESKRAVIWGVLRFPDDTESASHRKLRIHAIPPVD